MNFSTLFRAYDTVVALRDAARKFSAPPSAAPETSLSQTAAAQGLAGQIETRTHGSSSNGRSSKTSAAAPRSCFGTSCAARRSIASWLACG